MRLQALALTLTLLIPSLGHLFKFAGLGCASLFVLIALLAGWFILPHSALWLRGRFGEKGARNLSLMLLLLLTVSFVLIYPRLNVQSGFTGSDRDDDADIATQELLAGHYPYYKTTYLGNRFTHFPGSLLLCAPFVTLTGKSAWQNIFWLGVLFFGLKRYHKSWSEASAFFIFLIGISPLLWYEVLTGGDLVANSIYVFVFFYLFTDVLISAKSSLWRRLFWGALLGISLSSRLYFLLLLPLFFFFTAQRIGFKRAWSYWLWVGGIFLAVTLPFYLYDPQNFIPLKNQWSKISNLKSCGISFSAFYMSAALLLSFILGYRYKERSYDRLFFQGILILMFFTLGYVLFGIFQNQFRFWAALNLSYGFGFSVLALFAFKKALIKNE